MVDVPALDLASLGRSKPGEASAPVRSRVVRARARQRERKGPDGPTCNARMGPGDLDRFASLGVEGRRLVLAAGSRLGLSARGFDRVRRVSRTLADLEGVEAIRAEHVAEALQYRHPELPGAP